MAIIVFIILAVAGVCVYDFVDGRNWQSATSTSRNMVIFENRNKKYGAYNLRTDYNDSLGIILGIFAFSLLLISVINASVRTAPVAIQLPKIDTIIMNIAAPPVEMVETVQAPYKIEGRKGGAAGDPSSDLVVKTPMEQMQRESMMLSAQETKTGQSNKTNGSNPDNRPSTLKNGAGLFGGLSKGTHTGINNRDNGPDPNTQGSFSGTEKAVKRKQLTRLTADDIHSNTACVIVLKVYINASGAVVRAENDGNKTTTTEKSLISKVISLVKEQIRYDALEGAAIQSQDLKINVDAI